MHLIGGFAGIKSAGAIAFANMLIEKIHWLEKQYIVFWATKTAMRPNIAVGRCHRAVWKGTARSVNRQYWRA